MPLIVRFFLLFLISACIAPPDFPEEALCEGKDFRGVFILNEGVWTQNNGRLDLWQNENSCQGVFEQVNGRPLGDVANFALLDLDTLFLVINNSRLLYKLQLPSLELLGSLSLPETSSPREIVRISPDKAYVTTFHTGRLYEINPVTMELQREIEVENSMDGIIFHGGKLVVACGSHPFDGDNNKLAIIDPSNYEVNYVNLPFENPASLAVYKDWILVSCKGNFDPNGPGGGLVVYDVKNENIHQSLTIKGSLFDLELVEDNLLAIGDSAIGRLNLNNWEWESHYIAKSQLTGDDKDLIYSLTYDKAMGELYIGIAPFGAVDGEVLRLDPFLNVLERKKAGLYPGQIFICR